MMAALEPAIVAALRETPPPRNAAELRARTGGSHADIAAALRRLRFQGKIAFDRLALSPSMLAEAEAVAPSPPPPSPAPLSERPTGEELSFELRRYAARVGVTLVRVSLLVAGRRDFVHNLPRTPYPLPATVRRVRDFIAAHPDGVAGLEPPPPPGRRRRSGPPAPLPSRSNDCPHRQGAAALARAATASAVAAMPAPLAERDAAEAMARADHRRRHERQSLAPVPIERAVAGLDLSPVEAVQTLCAADPHDLIIAINRRHPGLWRRAVLLGRALGETPAAALYRALERGLEAEEALAHG